MPRRDVRGRCACGVAMHVTSSEGTATMHSIELQFFLIAAVLRPVHSELLGTRGYLFLPATEDARRPFSHPGARRPMLRPLRQQGCLFGDPACHTPGAGCSPPDRPFSSHVLHHGLGRESRSSAFLVSFFGV